MTMGGRADRSLARTIRSSEVTLGTFISLGSSATTEVCALAGFDWLLIDLEHGSGTEGALIEQIRAAEAHGVATIVRTETSDRIRAGRALDVGASGIMLPRIDSVDDAVQAIAGLRYPPHGRRGVANYNRSRRFTLDTRPLTEVDEEILTVVQIETLGALREVDAIAVEAKPDVLFVGPFDLSAALGVYGQMNSPILLDALHAVVSAARKHGISAGILASNAAAAARYAEQGFNFLVVGSDATLMLGAARTVCNDLAAVRGPVRRPTS
ncbi:aldolase/citrate lyase family protein [Mycolicibacterium boenickei]